MYISSDTNIWIDFQIVGALELPFKLSHKFYMSEETLKDELNILSEQEYRHFLNALKKQNGKEIRLPMIELEKRLK